MTDLDKARAAAIREAGKAGERYELFGNEKAPSKVAGIAGGLLAWLPQNLKDAFVELHRIKDPVERMAEIGCEPKEIFKGDFGTIIIW